MVGRGRLGLGSLVAALGLALAMTGCGGDDDGAENAGGGGGTGGVAGSGGSAGAAGTGGGETGGSGGSAGAAGTGAGGSAGSGESLTFIVVQANVEETTPLAGATVAFDAPGGERTEEVTAADGTVTFDSVDWSEGTATVTAHLDGYDMVSMIGMDPDAIADMELVDDAMPLYLVDLDPEVTEPDMVHVTGTFSGLTDPANGVLVRALGAGATETWAGTGTDTYEMDVPQGTAFSLFANEWKEGILPTSDGYYVDLYRAMVQDFPAIDEATATLDLDLEAHEITSMTAEGAIVLPSRADSPLRGDSTWSNLWVLAPGNQVIGFASLMQRSEDFNQWNVSLEWCEVIPADDAISYYRVYNTGTGEISFALEDGYPVAGELEPPILDVPRWTSPSAFVFAHPIGDPLEWEVFDDLSEDGMVGLNLAVEDQVVWRVGVPTDVTRVTLPEVPSSAVASNLLGTSGLQLQLLAGITDAQKTSWRRLTYSRAIAIAQ